MVPLIAFLLAFVGILLVRMEAMSAIAEQHEYNQKVIEIMRELNNVDAEMAARIRQLQEDVSDLSTDANHIF